MSSNLLQSSFRIGVWLLLISGSYAQIDPGPRRGVAGAGGPVMGLKPDEEKLFWAGWRRFKEIYSVSGTIEKGSGLGPTFSGNSCAQCHSQPAAGGSSSSPKSPQVHRVIMQDERFSLIPPSNPQLILASLDRLPGQDQKIPPFIVFDGPIRVPRFITKPDGTPDGDVHAIFTIAGRRDAAGCSLEPPDFATEITKNNVVFRIPSPTFGAGLIEAIADSTLRANLAGTANQRQVLGIGGRFNHSANDGTISRFGWKAQNKSLLIFSAESYNVEIGVTSEVFPNERDTTPGCLFNPLPEDKTNEHPRPNEFSQAAGFVSDVANVAAFMRLSAPPVPTTHTPSELSGHALFLQVGCVLCHSETLETSTSTFGGMSHLTIHPYSDFALHHVGPGLVDHVSQGLADGYEFRTAPLWGVGQRVFFLHDGRTADLLDAIEAHYSSDENCGAYPHSLAADTCRSEANSVILKFNALPATQRQDILNFLRSL